MPKMASCGDCTLFWKKIRIIYSSESYPTGMFAIASEFLVRSKTAPLSVKIELMGMNLEANILDSWMLELSTRESHILEEFNASVGKKRIGCITHEELDFFAPNLKSLSINRPHVESDIFPPIFKSQFPSLRKLKLASFSFWPTGLFTNLTSLELHSGKMSPSRFLDVLEGNTALTNLRIVDHGPKRPGEDVCRGRLIHLPSLRFLLLEVCDLEFILTHISFPQSCGVTLIDPVYYMLSLPEVDRGTKSIVSGVPQGFIHDHLPQFIDNLSVEYAEDSFEVDALHLQCSLYKISNDA